MPENETQWGAGKAADWETLGDAVRKLCQDGAELGDLLSFVSYIVTEEDADGGEDGLEDEDDSE